MLSLHRASRGDLLVGRLAELLAVPPDDPFVPDVVAVPTRGVERWLTQQLSMVLGTAPRRADGVCANIQFPFPAALIGTALAAASGVPAQADPWSPDRAVWPLLEVVEELIDEPWMDLVAAHLGRGRDGTDDDDRRSRRWSTVRHLADLFDRYGVHRPELVRAWAAGEDVDASGHPLPPDLAWQAPLWRALRARIGTPSAAERLEPACALLRDEPGLVGLPSRLSVFGLTRLSGSYLAVLAALAAHREVHLWLLHPSEARWASTATGPAMMPGPRRSAGRRDRHGHPLLVTWGRDAREMQDVLMAGTGMSGAIGVAGTAGVDATAHPAVPVAAVEEEAIAGPDHPPTLLGLIQSGIRDDVEPPGPNGDRAGTGSDRDARPLLDPADRSVAVHSCHGRTRQVEVLRDVILGLLEDDPSLEPRDVIVMCPDIDTFAPLIQATFGPGQESSGRDLHVRLADRSLRQTNPLLTAVAQLLDLAAGRLTASAVLDFASSGPVRRRFGFDDDDLSRLEEWVRTSGIRWGLDAVRRAPFQLSSIRAGTWESGLDRLTLGVAMSEDDLRLFGGVLPLDDVGSGEVERVGRLAELIDRLSDAVDAFAAEHPLDEWLALMAEAADRLTATSERDAWQRLELQAILSETAGSDSPLSLSEVRSLLAHRLEGRPTRANFRTGHLTMCTLVPMRSVPHRVVCLLGLDDGVFPRHPATDGDDLLARDPWVGDRDTRSEDRQLLLDALLAAREHLVITYTGRSERTNLPRPPSVPVGELLDVIDATVRLAGGEPARRAVLVEHPLQRWDARNFTPGTLGVPGPASFDPIALDAARAATRPRAPAADLAGAVLPPDRPEQIELDDLVKFVEHPVQAFLRQRLNIRLPYQGDDIPDAIPVSPDGLDRWRIGDRLLKARLDGADPLACRAAELARGDLPPLLLGEPFLDVVMGEVDALLAAARRLPGPLDSVDVTVEVGDRLVVGTVNDLQGDQLSTVVFSQLGPRHRVAAWVRLLALSAALPERAWRARCVGRGPKSSARVRLIRPIGPDPAVRMEAARRYLAALVDLYDRGRCEPLPLFCQTSEAWAAAVAQGRPPAEAARACWVTPGSAPVPKEDDDRAHRLVFGGRRPFEELLESRPGPDEEGEGWEESE
ncbi:MAG: exodeoxyribonuclease V subunit gamma, partial [Acidimicrobiaceae bacterium]|nr:exodeoxyribonuclease V subunit gamma [Acidimicrobiaceae bacterium]